MSKPSRRFALLISAWDDGVASWNPIIASAGKIRLDSFNNDRENMRQFLIDHAGFDRTCIYELKATQKTTPDEVRSWFASLKAFCLREDSEAFVVVHYSGHGTFKVDADGDEKAESSGGGGGWGFRRRLKFPKDEILAVHEDCCIVDDELHELLDFGSKTSTLCLLDCCHSGTMADLKFKYAAKGAKAALEPRVARKDERRALHRVISISGCTDKQEAKMSAHDGEIVGNLTKSLLVAWREEGGLELPILTDLIPRAHVEVDQLTHGTQRPQLCASFHIATQATPFNPSSWA